VNILLHVGAGTFRPVSDDDPSQHVMHEEWCEVSAEAAARLNAIRARGNKIWVVGTTGVRTLETVTDAHGIVQPYQGNTDIFLRPPYQFRGVDHLITNFHLPKSTLIMLVAAFAGFDATMHAYRTAVAEQYRFYSYGDAMAIV
jgi:S-adenosylmethionine:tRNA ribosyltransferase-isomerase